jgi:hypothetical protein
MIGQIYFWRKKIEELHQPWSIAELIDTELPGINTLSLQELETSTFNQAQLVKSAFLKAFLELLDAQTLRFASQYWRALSSPYVAEFEAKSGFWEQVQSWFISNNEQQLADIIHTGWLSLHEEETMFAFGLQVLSVFSPSTTEIIGEWNRVHTAKQSIPSSQLSSEPEILYYGSHIVSPLFINMNMAFRSSSSVPEQDIQAICNTVQANPGIRLILVDIPEAKDRIKQLEKKLPRDILISTIHLESHQLGFFDELTKQTLGVRLT